MQSLESGQSDARSGVGLGVKAGTTERGVKHFLAALLASVLLACCVALSWGCAADVSGTDASTAGEPAAASQSAAEAVGSPSQTAGSSSSSASPTASVTEDSSYTSKDDVALYLHLYGHLPGNYVTKAEARAAGWDSSANYVGDVCPGKSIGGDRYYNDEGLLPDAAGRRYYECDIDYGGARRGAKRIVFSNDGLVFYTSDHYNTFEQLY